MRRETIYLNAFLGQFITEVINGRLKGRIQEPRPTEILGKGYGMPSSHAQFCGFFVAFWTFHFLVQRPRRAQRPARENYVFIALVCITCALTCYSRCVVLTRCHLFYHTSAQVAVGACLGSIIGTVYYAATELFLRGAPKNSLICRIRHFFFTNYVSRVLRLRDSWSVWPDGGVDIEYATWLSRFGASGAGILKNGSLAAHINMMLLALAQADHCDAVQGAFSVGCTIAVPGGQLTDPSAPVESLQQTEPRALTTGFSREFPGNTHAEECALEKLARYCGRTPEAQGRAAIDFARNREPIRLLLYTTMEPCSERLSGNKPCVTRILEANALPMYTTAKWLAKLAASNHDNTIMTTIDPDALLRPVQIEYVFQGVPEPADFVQCVGQRTLRHHGINVVTVTPEAAPSAIGVTCPNLASVPIVVDARDPTTWLSDACLRMARKGHKA